MIGHHRRPGAAVVPWMPRGCRRLAWTVVRESYGMFGITYTSDDDGVRVAQIASYAGTAHCSWKVAQTASYADGTCCSWEVAAGDRGAAHWDAGDRGDGVAFSKLILKMSQLMLTMTTTVLSTISVLTAIGSGTRSQIPFARVLAAREASDASALGCRTWLPMGTGTDDDAIYITHLMGSCGDSPDDADMGKWPLGPLLWPAKAGDGGSSLGCSSGGSSIFLLPVKAGDWGGGVAAAAAAAAAASALAREGG